MKRQLGQLLLLLRVLDQPLCDFLGRSCVRPSELEKRPKKNLAFKA